ncbi:MAG: DUF4833 domain-containing protein [Acidobacteriota bacterium]|nr:DUF4833 domain-containing protein [Acidobacteriota bacterium]
MRARSLLILSFVAMAAAASADEAFVPLFVIERSVNGNTVHYDAKLRDGKLDPQQPVVAYWILSENGKRQELNLLERLKAYGFTIKPDKVPETYRMTLVADKNKEIRVFRMGAAVRAEAMIGTCEAYLQKIWVVSKKSFMINLPEYVDMVGNDMSTGAECHERVTPGDR